MMYFKFYKLRYHFRMTAAVIKKYPPSVHHPFGNALFERIFKLQGGGYYHIHVPVFVINTSALFASAEGRLYK